ncbi:Lipid-A-disaccharide synthase [Caenispirillum salinarum AK4]|uniref:Lipid-A-disaccharide synthase n=1 Tax=Caenispirillum salinarum AK4 TaxID=1238182 RepID=K9GZU5_9PROT|nr:lipid-A-disaccharide synthase [Caenispirillum salinarum]EKV30812.1 Lipid-A-disaccharide synthase [Caenispirillum salinarum AK4]
MTEARPPLVFIVTGEPSGDLLGGRLMAALREATEGQVRFVGIGGESMAEQGLDSLVDLSELAVMGFLEVLPKARRILGIVRDTADEIARLKPDVVVTVDSWGFTGRLHKAIRKRGLPVAQVHYVAPMVWAWKEKRAKSVAERVDHLMCLLPNEPPYFERHGLDCTHVGHSIIESGADAGDGDAFRAAHGIPAGAPLLCVLPGSRRVEVSRLLPEFRGAVERLAADRPGLRVAIPTVATVAADVEAAVADWPVPVTVVRGQRARYDAFAACDGAMAASGTVALELAMAGVPHLVAYRVSPLSAWLFRRLTTVRYVNLVNLTLDRPVVPEILQEACTAERLASETARLLDDTSVRACQREGFAEALEQFKGGAGSPSAKAAAVVLQAMSASRTY